MDNSLKMRLCKIVCAEDSCDGREEGDCRIHLDLEQAFLADDYVQVKPAGEGELVMLPSDPRAPEGFEHFAKAIAEAQLAHDKARMALPSVDELRSMLVIIDSRCHVTYREDAEELLKLLQAPRSEQNGGEA